MGHFPVRSVKNYQRATSFFLRKSHLLLIQTPRSHRGQVAWNLYAVRHGILDGHLEEFAMAPGLKLGETSRILAKNPRKMTEYPIWWLNIADIAMENPRKSHFWRFRSLGRSSMGHVGDVFQLSQLRYGWLSSRTWEIRCGDSGDTLRGTAELPTWTMTTRKECSFRFQHLGKFLGNVVTKHFHRPSLLHLSTLWLCQQFAIENGPVEAR